MEAVVEISCKAFNDGELSLCQGDIITNIVQVDKTWWEGSLRGHRGRFKEEFVNIVPKESSKTSTDTEHKVTKREGKKRRAVKALYSYAPANDDELELKINDMIEVIEETEEGWWKGVLKGSVGMFPSNFVTELILDSSEFSAVKEDCNVKLPGKRETYITANSSPSSPSDREQKSKSLNISVGSGSVTMEDEAKTGSFTGIDKRASNPKKPLVGTDTNAPQLPPKPVREQARVLYPYEAQNEDELTLKEGDIITVISKEIEDKGWWRGELNSQVGVFPDNFVELIKFEDVTQKKPDRPDKPVLSISSKLNSKPERPEKPSLDSSPLSEKKVSKTPPAKPPPPEIHKKDEKPERPVPPHPTKKPQLPPPMKKPLRSSLGSKSSSVASSSSTSDPNDNSISDATFPAGLVSSSVVSPSLKTGILPNAVIREPLVDSVFIQSDSNEVKDELVFDLLESNSDKLIHLTANRAKAPNRRPPSHIFLKENDKENGEAEDPNWLKELATGHSKSGLQIKDHKTNKMGSFSNTEEKPKVPPYRPSFPAAKTNITWMSKQETSSLVVTSASHTITPIYPSSIPPSEPSPENLKKVKESNLDISKEPIQLQMELTQVKNEFKLLKESMVSRIEYDELLNQVTQLKETIEAQKNNCKKLVHSLKTELEEEKKMRIATQLELEQIRKLVVT